ncbi:MAG: hypothetical protein ACOX60_06585 [Massiliimalia sp.]|jgi:hypothetical protein
MITKTSAFRPDCGQSLPPVSSANSSVLLIGADSTVLAKAVQWVTDHAVFAASEMTPVLFSQIRPHHSPSAFSHVYCILDPNDPQRSMEAGFLCEQTYPSVQYILDASDPSSAAESLASAFSNLFSITMTPVTSPAQIKTTTSHTLYFVTNTTPENHHFPFFSLYIHKKPFSPSFHKRRFTRFSLYFKRTGFVILSLSCLIAMTYLISIFTRWAGNSLSDFFCTALQSVSPTWLQHFLIGKFGLLVAPFTYGIGYLFPFGFFLSVWYCFWKQKGLSLRSSSQIKQFFQTSWHQFACCFFRMEPLLWILVIVFAIVSIWVTK